MLKSDFHIHTTRSLHPFYGSFVLDGLNSPREMALAAARKGLDVIAITDHNTLFSFYEAKKLTKEAGVVVIPGAELSFNHKEVLVLGVDSISAKTFDELKDEVKKRDGVIIACHPFDLLGRGHKNFKNFDAIEVQNGFATLRNFEKLNSLAKKLNKARVCGSDSHWVEHLGHVHCLVDAEPNIDSIISAIKHKKTQPVKATIPRHIFLKYYAYKLGGAWIWRKFK